MRSILERLVTLIGTVFLIGIALATLIGAVARYLFDQPIFGMSDMVIVMMVVVVAGSVSLTALRDDHIELTISAFQWVNSPAAHVIRGATTSLVSAVCAYALVEQACGFERACITGDVSISHFPLYWVLSLAFVTFSVSSLITALKHLGNEREADQ